MKKDLNVTRTVETQTGKLADNVGFKMSSSNVVTPLTQEQLDQQAANIKAWQRGERPSYTN